MSARTRKRAAPALRLVSSEPRPVDLPAQICRDLDRLANVLADAYVAHDSPIAGAERVRLLSDIVRMLKLHVCGDYGTGEIQMLVTCIRALTPGWPVASKYWLSSVERAEIMGL